MFSFRWRDWANDALLARLAAEAGSTAAATELRTPVAAILEHTGGLPLVDAVPTAEQQLDIALLLVGEAVDRALARASATPTTGYLVDRSGTARALPRVDVNHAAAGELEALPSLGPVLAGAIVAERNARGAFASLDDLARRVAGVGERTVAALVHVLDVQPPSAAFLPERPAADALGPRLRLLCALAGDLPSALSRLAADVALTPHPASRLNLRRTWDRSSAAPPAAAASVDVWWSEDYLPNMAAAIGAARLRVAVCMFHITGGESHPTRQLLVALRDARDAGAEVRVLVDRDRSDDPYLSTIVNAPARHWLREAGVDVRSDSGARLLHSKFVLIDDDVTVIGSHNWTAGSYAGYDDLSLRIASAPLAAAMWQRFEFLWEQGR